MTAPGGADRPATVRVRPGHTVAAALVPPLGLHLAAVRPRDFWIGTALTVLGFVPGAMFALYLLLRRSGTALA